MMSKIIIIIIIILLIIIASLFILNLLKPKNKTSGGSSSIIFDLMNYGLLRKEVYSENRTAKTIKHFDEFHDTYLKYVMTYINTSPIETNNTNIDRFIVGDVHGSILQLFMPLKQAGILKKIELKEERNEYDTIYKFRYKLASDEQIRNSKQVIYCGDFFGRARHSLTVAMLYTFISIYNTVNRISRDKIVWVFGNHDVGFIRKFIYNYDEQTYRSHVYLHEIDDIYYDINNNIYPDFIELFKQFIDDNPYPCIYYDSDSNIMVSHTFMKTSESTEVYMHGLGYMLNVYDLYDIFDPDTINMFKNKITDTQKQMLNSSITELLEESLRYYTSEEAKNEFNRLSNIEQVNYLNDIAKYVVIKYSDILSLYLEPSFYWTYLCKKSDDDDCEPYEIYYDNIYKFDNITGKKFKHFVGHDIVDICKQLKNHKDGNTNIHPLHNTYIRNIYDNVNFIDNDKNKVKNTYRDTNLKIAKNIANITHYANFGDNLKLAMINTLKSEPYNHIINFRDNYLFVDDDNDDFMKFVFKDSDIVFTDVSASLNFENFYTSYATFGNFSDPINTITDTLKEHMNEYVYNETEFDKLLENMYGSIDIGTYLCLFFKVDSNNNVELSNLYLF